jgi:CRP/FNR family transcriptional regulator, cyclic AMP receptor protein
MDVQVLQSYFRHFPLFDHLSPAEMEKLAKMSQYRTSPKHAFVYMADQPSTFLCLLVKGTIKTGVYAIDGREIIKTIHHPFTIFGELGLCGEKQRAEFGSTMNGEAGYIVIKVSDLQWIMSQNFAFSQAVMLFLGERLRKAERQWESLILKDVRTRILEFLKESAGLRGRQVGYEMLVKHSLTQQELANLIGASRQTVTAIMNDLRKNNIIYFNRSSILIRDMERLN